MKKTLKGIVVVLLTIICSQVVVAALDISPLKANLNQVKFGKEYTFFLTVINTDSTERGVEMQLAYTSQYLEPYVRFDPTFFKINGHDSKNVKITLHLDESIPIGEHILEAQPIADGRELIDTFTLDFAIPGAQVHSLDLQQFDVIANSVKEPVYINISIHSESNTIERISPKLLVRKEGNVVDITEYPTEYTIMPETTENILLFYDPIKLNEGVYSLELEIPYHDTSITQKNELDLSGTSSSAITTNELRSTNYTTGLRALFLLILLTTGLVSGPRLYYGAKKKHLLARIHSLEKNIHHHEHSFKDLMDHVAKFIGTANQTLSRYGEQYELK